MSTDRGQNVSLIGWAINDVKIDGWVDFWWECRQTHLHFETNSFIYCSRSADHITAGALRHLLKSLLELMSGLFWGFPGGICSTAENALPQMLTSKGKGAFGTAMSLALFVTGNQHCKPLATSSCCASDLYSEPLGKLCKGKLCFCSCCGSSIRISRVYLDFCITSFFWHTLKEIHPQNPWDAFSHK